MDLKGSKTLENLKAAFAGESQAHTKYLYYASKAKKDGYVQIGNLFEETAKNEKEHAKIWFKLLHGGSVPSTEENLADAVDEHKENGIRRIHQHEEAEDNGCDDKRAAAQRILCTPCERIQTHEEDTGHHHGCQIC